VRWVDFRRSARRSEGLPPVRQWPQEDGWKLSKQFGPPDLVLKSEATPCPPPVRMSGGSRSPKCDHRAALGPRRRDPAATSAGRRITHHVLARLQQEEPDKAVIPDADNSGPGMLMEWAIGKNYDIYRPNTGKLLLPGARIWWELHLHAVGEQIRDHAELAIYLYPKGQEPKFRTYLMSLQVAARAAKGEAPVLDIPPNTVTQTQGFYVLKQPARLENFQPHMHLRGKSMSMEAILPDGTRRILSSVDHFNFNWMTTTSMPTTPRRCCRKAR